MEQGDTRRVRALMRAGLSDEDILALTGVGMLQLVELRIEAAMEPGHYRRSSEGDEAVPAVEQA
jgi:hypothetical protein